MAEHHEADAADNAKSGDDQQDIARVLLRPALMNSLSRARAS
ncbi:hypothetical protein [Magnetospirillum gryphiswaldense]|nr:hypothetical protein [Magnetospirillum gryphiswaldense]